jgi:transposase-like protein
MTSQSAVSIVSLPADNIPDRRDNIKRMHRLKKAIGDRRKYPLHLKIQAVEAVHSGKKITHVAVEYGLPVQTLCNWLKDEQRGALNAAVHLSIEEMECIRDYCTMMISGGLLRVKLDVHIISRFSNFYQVYAYGTSFRGEGSIFTSQTQMAC